jgi:hypothetical protein
MTDIFKIYPRCVTGLEEYVSAHGIYFPCCWIGTEPHVNQVKEFLGPLFEQLNTNKYSMDEIKSSQAMKKIETSWDNEEIAATKFCSMFCSKKISTDKLKNGIRNSSVYISLK